MQDAKLRNIDLSRTDLSIEWRSNNTCHFNDFRLIIASIYEHAAKERVAKIWLSNPSNNCTFDNLNELLASFGDNDRAKNILEAFVKRENDSNARYDLLKQCLQRVQDIGGLQYDTDIMSNLYQELQLPKEKIVEFCKEIYPNNERIRTEFFIELISNEYINKDKTPA